MTSSDNQNQRRQIIIDRSFQLRIVARLSMYLVACFVFFVAVVILGPLVFGLLTGGADEALRYTRLRLEFLGYIALFPLLSSVFVLAAIGLRESFRVAGPCFRFRTVFELLRELRIPRGVRIRGNDHLQETAQSLNSALVSLHDELAILKALGCEADQTFKALQDNPGDHAALCDLAKPLNELGKKLSNIELLSASPECRPLDDKPDASVVETNEPVAASSSRLL